MSHIKREFWLYLVTPLLCFDCADDERDSPPHEISDCQPISDSIEIYSTSVPANRDPVDIYYPASTSPTVSRRFPPALLLQGGKADKQFYSEYAAKVAAYGFAVVVPNHHSTFKVDGYSADGFYAELAEIDDLLDFLRSQNQSQGSPLQDRLDLSRLAWLGHSFGAAVIIEAIQNRCAPPFCEEGSRFTRPVELKAVALHGINTRPAVGGDSVAEINNDQLPIAIINGDLDGRVTYEDTLLSYLRIEDPPKALVHIKGANHFALCNINNPPGPMKDSNDPTLEQNESIKTAARWAALFLRAHVMGDACAISFVYNRANRGDQVSVISQLER